MKYEIHGAGFWFQALVLMDASPGKTSRPLFHQRLLRWVKLFSVYMTSHIVISLTCYNHKVIHIVRLLDVKISNCVKSFTCFNQFVHGLF